jgi:exonuclease III
MKFGTWNVRSLYMAGLFTAAARELARYKLDLVGVQEVRWDKWVTARAGDFFFLWEIKPSIGNRVFLYTTEYY